MRCFLPRVSSSVWWWGQLSWTWWPAPGWANVPCGTHHHTGSFMWGCVASLRFLSRRLRPSWISLTGHLPNMAVMTKWFHSTRLETRTKESSICASSWVSKPTCAMKVITENLASAADRSIRRGLSMSISVRTRKMVNYACEG